MIETPEGFSNWIKWDGNGEDRPDDKTVAMVKYSNEEWDWVRRWYTSNSPSLSFRDLITLPASDGVKIDFYSVKLDDENH